MGRSTFEITLGDETFEGRTTFEAIDEFENKAGINIIDAWEALGNQKYKFSHIATAVWAAINGERKLQGQKPLLWAAVGQMVHEHGFLNCIGYASTFYAHTLPEDKGDIKESEEDQKKSTE